MNPFVEDILIGFVRSILTGLLLLMLLCPLPSADDAKGGEFTPTAVLDVTQVVGR